MPRQFSIYSSIYFQQVTVGTADALHWYGAHFQEREDAEDSESREAAAMATKQQFPQSDLLDVPRGMHLLNRQRLNKGTAFTEEELLAGAATKSSIWQGFDVFR
jgi:hypothetical protein